MCHEGRVVLVVGVWIGAADFHALAHLSVLVCGTAHVLALWAHLGQVLVLVVLEGVGFVDVEGEVLLQFLDLDLRGLARLEVLLSLGL